MTGVANAIVAMVSIGVGVLFAIFGDRWEGRVVCGTLAAFVVYNTAVMAHMAVVCSRCRAKQYPICDACFDKENPEP